jgi:hypothetical protein
MTYLAKLIANGEFVSSDIDAITTVELEQAPTITFKFFVLVYK